MTDLSKMTWPQVKARATELGMPFGRYDREGVTRFITEATKHGTAKAIQLERDRVAAKNKANAAAVRASYGRVHDTNHWGREDLLPFGTVVVRKTKKDNVLGAVVNTNNGKGCVWVAWEDRPDVVDVVKPSTLRTMI